ncbi:hypothetical protein EIP91_005104 [Steccherinum ochraceum]|uniref:BTB domain-containing protein n=1 Tax=Steccherinum ochraceum TaxID=92696 RepID=A0A4R0RG31_9APHY|nr:hypothetical protein EIP91_005104 [Steccherinum ochraceum]
MEDTRISKRPRTDVSEPTKENPSESAYEQGLVWWEDGNLVLVAEYVAFRIHKSMLARKSQIFCDMFSIPQPSNSDQYDGCPVVHMSDSAKDVSHVLSVLYDSEKYIDPKEGIDFDVIAAMLKLGRKYQMDQLVNLAVTLLQTLYPPTLFHYDKVLTVTFSGRRVARKTSHHISVLNLARRFELHQLLPPAFLACSQFSYQELVNGPPGNGEESLLSRADIARCLTGRVQLRARWMRRLEFVQLTTPSVWCNYPARCRTALEIWKKEHLWEFLQPSDTENAMENFYWLDRPGTTGLCELCTRFFKDGDRKARQQTWNSLAQIFDLEDVVEWPPQIE